MALAYLVDSFSIRTMYLLAKCTDAQVFRGLCRFKTWQRVPHYGFGRCIRKHTFLPFVELDYNPTRQLVHIGTIPFLSFLDPSLSNVLHTTELNYSSMSNRLHKNQSQFVLLLSHNLIKLGTLMPNLPIYYQIFSPSGNRISHPLSSKQV
jgi:hypothetical protein